MKIKQPSPEALAFIREHKERLDHLADELIWFGKEFVPVLKSEGVFGKGWYLTVSRERFEREDIPAGTELVDPREAIQG